jgi:hypothetical protein
VKSPATILRIAWPHTSHPEKKISAPEPSRSAPLPARLPPDPTGRRSTDPPRDGMPLRPPRPDPPLTRNPVLRFRGSVPWYAVPELPRRAAPRPLVRSPAPPRRPGPPPSPAPAPGPLPLVLPPPRAALPRIVLVLPSPRAAPPAPPSPSPRTRGTRTRTTRPRRWPRPPLVPWSTARPRPPRQRRGHVLPLVPSDHKANGSARQGGGGPGRQGGGDRQGIAERSLT